MERVLYIPRCVVAIIKRGQGSTEPEKKKLSTFDFNYGTGEEWHYHLRKSLEELGQMLRTLPNLPLSINAVSGISPVCRFTEVGKLKSSVYFSHHPCFVHFANLPE